MSETFRCPYFTCFCFPPVVYCFMQTNAIVLDVEPERVFDSNHIKDNQSQYVVFVVFTCCGFILMISPTTTPNKSYFSILSRGPRKPEKKYKVLKGYRAASHTFVMWSDRKVCLYRKNFLFCNRMLTKNVLVAQKGDSSFVHPTNILCNKLPCFLVMLENTKAVSEIDYPQCNGHASNID